MKRRASSSGSAVAYATLVIVLVAAAGVLLLYSGVAPVATVTRTLPPEISTSTSVSTSITTLPAQLITVTATSTQTTTVVSSTTLTSTQTVTTTSLKGDLLTNKTVIASGLSVSIEAGPSCGMNCNSGNETTILNFNVTSAGYLIISGTQVSGEDGSLSVYVNNVYSSIADNVGCGVNVSCTEGYYYIPYPTYQAVPTLYPVLPGPVTLLLYNSGNETASATLTILYYY